MDCDILCTQAIPDVCGEDSDNSVHYDGNNSREKVAILKVLFKGESTEQSEFPIFRGQNTIGRLSTCDISIPWSVTLSKKHAIIEAEDETCFLWDCGSSNKTRFGRVQLKANAKYGLRDGDEITFGDVKCVFHQNFEKDEVSTVNCAEDFLARDTPDFVSDEKMPSLDTEAPTEDSHANETDVTHVSDSNGDANYHMDSDTDVEDNKTDLDETCMSDDDIYQANTLPFSNKSTSQKTESSQYEEELDDDNDYEMSLIADLADEQTQKFHDNQPTSEDLPKHGDKSTVNNNESSTEKDMGNLKIENSPKTSDIQESSNVKPHNDDDMPCCSGINQNPVSHLLTDTYDDDSFGDLCTQAFVMPKKSALCEDTLGLLETQALILPSSAEDEPNINASIFEDMPTQAFPINVGNFNDDSDETDNDSKAIEERVVPELSSTPDIVSSSTSDQDSASTTVPWDTENQSSADLIGGLSNAACEKPRSHPINCEGDYVSDSTSVQNTDSASSIQFIGKSDDEVKTDNKATRDNAVETLSDKQDASAYDSHSDNDDTLPFVVHTEENLTGVKSGFNTNISNRDTSIYEDNCIDDNDDTQPLQRKAPELIGTAPQDDDAPRLPRTGDVVVPLEEYFSDIPPKRGSLEHVNHDNESTRSNLAVSGTVQTKNFEKLCVNHRSKLTVTNNQFLENLKTHKDKVPNSSNVQCDLQTTSDTSTADQSVKSHSTTICHVQNLKITDQPKAPAHQMSDHGPVLTTREIENEISDDDATQEYDVTSIEETPIIDASKLQNNVANAIFENRPAVDRNSVDRIEILQNDDNVTTQVYDLTSVEETSTAVIVASAQQGIAPTPFDKNPLSVNQKELANVMDTSQNQQTSDSNENDATTQEYDINTMEEPTTANVTHDIKEPGLVGNTTFNDSKPQNNPEVDSLDNETDIHNLSDQARNSVPSLADSENFDSAEMKSSLANKQPVSGILTDENSNIVESNPSLKAAVPSTVEMRCSTEVQSSANSVDLDATQPYNRADPSIISNHPIISSAVGTAKSQMQDLKACVESGNMPIGNVNVSITNDEFADDCAATQPYVKPAPVEATPLAVATCSVTVGKSKETGNSISSKYSLTRKDFPLSDANVSKVPECHAAISKTPERQVIETTSSSTTKSHNSNTKRYSLRKKNNSIASGDTLDGLESMQTQSFIKISKQETSTTIPIASANVDKCDASKYSLNKKSNLPSSRSNFDGSDIMQTQQLIKQPDPQVVPAIHIAKPDTHKDSFTNRSLQIDDTFPIGNSDVSVMLETQSFIKQPQTQISQTPPVKITPKENANQISPSISQHDVMENSPIRTRSRRSARKDYAKLANGEPLPVERKSSKSSKGVSEKVTPKLRSDRVQAKSPLQGNNSSVQSTGGATTSTRSTRSKTSANLTGQTKQNKHTDASPNPVSSDTNIEVIENAANKKSSDKLQSAKRKKSSAINKKTVDVQSNSNSAIIQNTKMNKSKETKTFPKRSLRSAPSEDITQKDKSNPANWKDVNKDVYDFESSAVLTIDLVKGSQSAEDEEDENESVPSTSTGRRQTSKRGITKPDPTFYSSKSVGKKKAVTTSDASKTAELSVNRMDGLRKRRNVFHNSLTAKRSKSNESDQVVKNRPKRVTTKPKVMFTGIMDNIAEAIVTNLGGNLATDINECTHLVTDKMRRTIKFLCAVSIGVHIVTPQWLHRSIESKRFLPEEEFHLTDDIQTLDGEALQIKYNFNLQNTLQMVRESKNPLFHNLTIFVTKNVAPNPQQMKQILESAGAKVISKMPKFTKEKNTNLVIVSTQDDKRSLTNAIKFGCRIVSNEFVLTGVLRHQVDFTSFSLFGLDSDVTQNQLNQSSNLNTMTKRRRMQKN